MSRDRVDPELALEIFERDGSVAVKLGADPAGCRGRLTIEHVKKQPRLGVRAESLRYRMVSICEGHSENGMKAGAQWNTAHRPELRDHLEQLERAEL